MPKTRNARGQHVTDSALVSKGRKGLIKASGLGSARSPLTQQLIETLSRPDSYVSIPLVNGRSKSTTIFNLKDKAKRNKVQLHFTLSGDEKNIFAWFTKIAPKAVVTSKARKGTARGPQTISPVPEAVSA